ncbi:MAG: PEP-CTERM sorting domain-containing protein [Akkermansiaceae bacterium]
MKTTLIIAASCAALATTAFGQSNGVLAHWDFVDGSTGSASLYPEDNGIDCVTPKKIKVEGLSYSWSTIDSEDGSRYGANCFSGWSKNDCVIFDVDFANDAVGQIDEINFDVGNYGGSKTINQVSLRIWKNGTELTSSGQFVKNFSNGTSSNPWTASSDTSFDVSGLGLNSSAGSDDKFRFAIFVTDSSYSKNSRIALDNFRAVGHVDCVPEPSSAALLGLAGIATLLRRKR